MAAKGYEASASKSSFLAPERLYALRGFIRASGVSRSRLREARLAGEPLLTLALGRRVYVRGQDAIAFIERLAQAEKA